MLPNRIRISKRASDQLKTIKAHTQVTPNILCRIALMLSLRATGLPDTTNVSLDGAEFNQPTLFGEHGLLYECLIRQVHGEQSPKDIQIVLASHIERGVNELKRVRSMRDLLSFEGLE